MMSISASRFSRKYRPGSRSLGALLLLGLAGLLAACGSGSSSSSVSAKVAPTLSSIAVTATPASVSAGSTSQFNAVGKYSDGTSGTITTSVTWTSATTTVATIAASGLATGVAAGTSVITATSGSITGTATLTVTAAKTLTSVAISPSPASVIAGSTTQLTAVATFSDGSISALTTGVTWTSTAAAAVVTVGATTGLATGVAVGTSSVTVTYSGMTSPLDTLTVTPAEFAFVTNFGENTVSQFRVGPGGSLVANGSPVGTGVQPFALAPDPTGKYLYVGNFNSDTLGTVSEYGIGTNGQLTALATPNIPAGQGANGMTVYNNNVYVANIGDSTITQYSINATTGQLTTVATTSSGTSTAGAASITFYTNSAGTFAYVPNYKVGTISVFSVNATSGLLSITATSTATIPTGSTGPVSLAIDLSGKYAYVADLGSSSNTGDIAQFSINADGSLTALAPPTAVSGGNPRWITVDPKTGTLYVPNAGANSVQTFTVGTGGQLTASAAATLASVTNPNYLAFDPTSTLLYVADRGGTFNGQTGPFDNTISQFSVSTTSGLAPLAPPTVTTGATSASEPTTIAFTLAN